MTAGALDTEGTVKRKEEKGRLLREFLMTERREMHTFFGNNISEFYTEKDYGIQTSEEKGAIESD